MLFEVVKTIPYTNPCSVNLYVNSLLTLYLFHVRFVGLVPLFDVNAIVLFDSGATHSFVASSFVQTHKLEVTKDTKG